MHVLQRNIRMVVLSIFIKRILRYTHMLKHQTVNFKYGQFNICRLYSGRWLKKVSGKLLLFQKFKVYRALLLEYFILLVNVHFQ